VITQRFTQLKNKTAAFIVVTMLAMATVVPAFAQDGTLPLPIGIGENRAGAIDASNFLPQFSMNAAGPQSVQVQVLAITPGLLPAFRVFDPTGVTLENVGNTNGQTIVQSNINLPSSGLYTIEVQSANGAPGEFLLSLQGGLPIAAPISLVPGQGLPGIVDPQNPMQMYNFTASQTDVLLLTLRSDLPAGGPVVTMRDAISGQMISLTDMSLIGLRFRLPIGARSYSIEVAHSGAALPESYIVCLETEAGTTPCADGAAPQSQPAVNVCGVSINGQSVNVRSGAGTGYGVIATLDGSAPVLAKLTDNSWYQINVNGVIGWVASGVVVISGDCANIPGVVPPPIIVETPVVPAVSPTPVVTDVPTAVPTDVPTDVPSPEPTNVPDGDDDDGPIYSTVIPFIPFNPDLIVTAVPTLIYGPVFELPGDSTDLSDLFNRN